MQDNLLRLQDLRQVEHLELLARQVVEGFILGLHKSPFHGFSVEFAEHRIYNPGEPIRYIDWKVFGRTDRLYSKKFEEETNLRCQIVIDTSSSMYYPDVTSPSGNFIMNKVVFSSVCAAAIIHLLRNQRDAAGLSFFDKEVNLHTRAASGSVHHKLLMSHLESFVGKKSRNEPTYAAACLHQIAEQVHRRSLVVLFTDMLEGGSDLNELFSALQHLKYNKHEVILFHVSDHKTEREFNYDNRPYVFVDMETGKKVRLRGTEIKKQYTSRMSAYLKEVKLRCDQYSIDFIDADINQPFSKVLLPYLIKRTRLK
jgi:uncharacterized protein (DUF58 family)